MKKFISALVAGAMLAVAAAPALAGPGGPGPGPGWGPGPGPRWHAAPPPPPRGGWGWGHRYWGPGDWTCVTTSVCSLRIAMIPFNISSFE